MAICGLCKQPRQLRNSHILPEFLYKPLYDVKHRAVGIHGRAPRNCEFLQKGIREKLLCHDCEQFLNDKYEKNFKKLWFDEKKLPNRIHEDLIVLRDINYTTFKLFHLSILYRCSISSYPMFRAVELGPHLETIRAMLKDVAPGDRNQYPIFGHAVIDKHDNVVHRLVTCPIKSRYEGHNVYGIMFGGCMWYYTVSSHKALTMSKVSVSEEGSLFLRAERWENMNIVQQLGKLLRG